MYDVDKALQRAVELGELGVQVAAYVEGELVVDAWTGPKDVETGEQVDGDTLFPVFSTTKAVTATALHVQAERGLIDYEAKVVEYWPEYGANGKDQVAVRDILIHRSGAPQMPADVTPETIGDWDWVVDRLANLVPLHAPGERTIYHSLSFGWLVGELVRRTDPQHRPFGQFVREEVLDPIGVQDIYLGLPESEEHRVATLVPPTASFGAALELRDVTMPPAVAPGARYNVREMHAACNPGAGGIMNARSGARFFAMLANGGELDGVRLLSEDRLRALTTLRPRPHEDDESIPHVAWLGTGGYWVGGESPPAPPEVGTGTHVLTHPGAGGSIGWADLDTKLAVTICHNRMFRNDPPVPLDDYPFFAVGERARAIAAEHTSR